MARRKRNRLEQQAAEMAKARRDYMRARKAKQQQRKLLAFLLPILAVVGVTVAFGWFRLEWWTPRQPVARVGDVTITAADYGKRVQFARRQTLNSLSSLLGFMQSSDPSFIQQYAEGQRMGVPEQTLDQMIDELMIRQEANSRGIEVTDDEIQHRVCSELSRAVGATGTTAGDETEDVESDSESVDDADSATDAVTIDDDTADEVDDETSDQDSTDEGDDVATTGEEEEDVATTDDDAVATTDDDIATSEDGDDGLAGDGLFDDEDEEHVCALDEAEIKRNFDTILQPQLTQAGMARRDYEAVIRAQLYSEKLTEALGEEIATTAEQVELSYLLFTNDGVAQEAASALETGASWEDVVNRFTRPDTPTAADPNGIPVGDEDTSDVDSDDAEAAEDEGSGGDAEGDDDASTSDDDVTGDVDDDDSDVEDDSDVKDGEGETDATDDDSAIDEDDSATDDDSVTTGDDPATDEDDVAADEDDSATDDDTATDDDVLATVDADDAADGTPEATATATATPMPSPTPEPFAFEIGDSAWYALEELRTRFGLTVADAQAAFDLDRGESSGPLAGNRGSFILHLEAKEADRRISESELDRLKNQSLEDWLSNQRIARSSEISRFPTGGLTPPEPDWFVQGYQQLVGNLPSQQLPLDLGGNPGAAP